jgi:methylated-DNA-[protein]-cysteine S-methyltransferase
VQSVKATARTLQSRKTQEKTRPLELALAVFETDLGWIAMAGQGEVLHALVFGQDSPREAAAALEARGGQAGAKAWKTPLERRLKRFARGERDDFRDVRVAPFWTTEFQRQVLEHCRRIAYGAKRSYAELATLAGSPGAARAVGSVMRKNRIPLVIPCHRVVGSSGLGGYSGAAGLTTKQLLLELEGRGR